MNDLVTPNSENRRAQGLVRLSVDQHLHEPLRLTLLDRPANSGHGSLRDEGWTLRLTDLALGRSDPPEGWVDVERVGRNAVAHTPRIIVQQVSGDDFKVVVRGVGEGALAVTVAERPDA